MARSFQRHPPNTPFLQRKTKAYPSLVIQQIERLEADYGGRSGLLGLLVLAPMTPDLEYFLGQIGDPYNAQQSLAEICAQSNILPGHLLHVLMSASHLHAKARTAHQAQQGIAPVVADILHRAAPFEQDCPECMVDGKSTGAVTPEPTDKKPNPGPEPCPRCKGALKLLYLPELARQELALNLAQLLPKGGGINIQNTQHNLTVGAGGSTLSVLDQVQQLAEEALYGEGSALLEAEIVENPPETEDPLPATEDPLPEGTGISESPLP